MTRSQLAKKLIASRSIREAKRLLSENAGLSDVRLARRIREICYAMWTVEPAAAQRAARALDLLTDRTEDNEIESIATWVGGISEITKGNLRSAADRLQSASRSFRAQGLEHESAQPLVAALIALGMLGEYREADRLGRKALRIFEKYDDQLSAGKIEMNLSNVVSRVGKHRRAEEYCASALQRFKKAREPKWQAMAENGLANTYTELNEFKKAEKYFAAALETAKKAGMTLTVAEVESSLGTMALVRGRLDEALRLFESSRQKYETLRMPHQTAIAETEIATIYAELNLTAEAANLYRRAAERFKKLSLAEEEARSRAGHARAAVKLGKMRPAERQFAIAAELYKSRGNKAAAAITRLDDALMRLRYDHSTLNSLELDKLQKALQRLENPRYALAGRWLEAESIAAHAPLIAERKLNSVFADASKSEFAGLELAALNSLGHLALKRRDLTRANDLFEKAASWIETSRARLQADEFRIGYFSGNLEPYERLVEIALKRGDLDAAFAANERMRSRSLVETYVTTNETTGDWELKTEIGNIREKLNWQYRQSENAGGYSPNDRSSVAKLEKKLASLERKLASTTTALGTAKRDKISPEAVRRALAKDEAIIEFVEIKGRMSAFVVGKNMIEHIELEASVPQIRSALEGLHFQFDSFRYGGEAVKVFSTHIKSRIDASLRRLYEHLVAPLAVSEQVQKLIFVPTGLLNYVPFPALFNGRNYMIEKAEISYAPSAAVWLKLGRNPATKIEKALLMAYADASIPLVEKEVKLLSKLFPQSAVFISENATFEAFRASVGKCDLIHLACHGTFRPDNPNFSSLHLADGWVTVADVVKEKIKARLVTLGACETGMSKVYAGNEILGLVRGFLAAGAKSLVASLWNINDAISTELMAAFYAELQGGGTVVASLRKAQIGLIERGENPYYWAPFFVIG